MMNEINYRLVLGGTTVLPWNRGTSFSRDWYRGGHGTTKYRSIFSRYLPWRTISGTAQHYYRSM